MTDLLSMCRLASYNPAAPSGLLAEWSDAEAAARKQRGELAQLEVENAVAVAVVRSRLARLDAPPAQVLTELSSLLAGADDELSRYRNELRLRLAATYLGSTPWQALLVKAVADLSAGNGDSPPLAELLVDGLGVSRSDLACGWAAICGRPLLATLGRIHDQLEPAPQGRPPRRVRPVRIAQQVVAVQLHRARAVTRLELAELCDVRTNTIHAWLRSVEV